MSWFSGLLSGVGGSASCGDGGQPAAPSAPVAPSVAEGRPGSEPEGKGAAAGRSSGSSPTAAPSSGSPVGCEDASTVEAAIRSKEQDVVRAAWRKLHNEFDVQVKVWESVALVSGAATSASSAESSRRGEPAAAATVRSALEASAADPSGAAKLLRPLGRAGAAEPLGQAAAAAVHGVSKAGRQAQLLSRLAAAVASAPSGAALDDARRAELEKLLGGCRLGETLESRARKALGLPPTQKELESQAKAERAEERAAARRAKEAEAQAYQAKVDRVAKAAGVAGDKARLAIDSSQGDVDQALVMLLSEAAAQQQRREDKAASAAQAREKEAAEVVAAMLVLADSTPRMAWEQVRAEFGVQLEVWNNQVLLDLSMGGGATPFDEAKAEIEGALEAASTDPRGAVLLLEMALQNAVDRQLELCAGVLTAADRLLDAERLAESRRALANKIKDSRAAGSAGDREASQLLAACDLGGSVLGGRAQKVLSARGQTSEDRRVQL